MFLSGPMYSAIYACTLAVFFKETLYDENLLIHSFIYLPKATLQEMLVIMFLSNLAIFKLCGQDWTRSSVFVVASLLLPAGYNNDTLYYQAPVQDILVDQKTCMMAQRLRQEHGKEETEVAFQPGTDSVETHTVSPTPTILVPMKSAKFLLMHVVGNTFLMLVCAIYIPFSRPLDTRTDDALVIPQLLGVIPASSSQLASVS